MHIAVVTIALAWFGGLAAAAAPPSTRPRRAAAERGRLFVGRPGWGDLSASGNPHLRTPNIDALARDGARFDRFYVSPVCSPTRAEFLTGRYHPRTGVRGVSAGQERLNLDERTLADALRAAGYATGRSASGTTAASGRTTRTPAGFDEYYGFTSGHWGEYFDPPLEHNGAFVRGDGFIADDLTGRAVAFVERNKDKPFLCYLPFNTPHSPFAVPDAYWQRFKDKPITQRGVDGAKEDLAVTRCALAMCENLDDNVGRVLRKLDELKLPTTRSCCSSPTTARTAAAGTAG
jgi:arylsulfatase A-like enzyme